MSPDWTISDMKRLVLPFVLIGLLAGLAAAQEIDVDQAITRLDDEDLKVRDAATQELIKYGPAVVPRIVELHRTTSSPEAKTRAETILKKFPFAACMRLGEKDALRDALTSSILEDVQKHRAHPDCKAKEDPPAPDPSRLRILWQTGSGHGQTLVLTLVRPAVGGGLLLRRLSYRRATPYRPEVKSEGVDVEESRMSPEEAKAFASLMAPALALAARCTMPSEREGHWMSSADFTARGRIESAGAEAWSGGYSGYSGSTGEPEYLHPCAIGATLRAVSGSLVWSVAEIAKDDRVTALDWMSGHYKEEKWWVKERYLLMAKFVGDETFLPFLREAAQEPLGEKDASGERRRTYAREAIERITGGGE